jgi:adenylate kinase
MLRHSINGLKSNYKRFYSASLTARDEKFSKRVMLMGPPGVGKGTYAAGASKILGVPHFSAGDIIREEIKSNSETGRKMVEYTTQGKLVPDELVLKLVVARLQAYSDQTTNPKGFILDGFPRTLHQAEIFNETPHRPTMVVNLDQRMDIIIRKISGRRVCQNCGETYNVEHIIEDGLDMPPMLPKVENICDKCGAIDSLIQRGDDRLEVVRERMDHYFAQTEPLISYYKKQQVMTTFTVNGSSKQLLPGFIKLLES